MAGSTGARRSWGQDKRGWRVLVAKEREVRSSWAQPSGGARHTGHVSSLDRPRRNPVAQLRWAHGLPAGAAPPAAGAPPPFPLHPRHLSPQQTFSNLNNQENQSVSCPPSQIPPPAGTLIPPTRCSPGSCISNKLPAMPELPASTPTAAAAPEARCLPEPRRPPDSLGVCALASCYLGDRAAPEGPCSCSPPRTLPPHSHY